MFYSFVIVPGWEGDTVDIATLIYNNLQNLYYIIHMSDIVITRNDDHREFVLSTAVVINYCLIGKRKLRKTRL